MLTSSKKKNFKNIMCGSSLSLLLLLLIGRTTTTTTFVGALQVGDDICTHGYIMDYFCINNKNMLDNRKPTLEKPMDHTVHCLLDVGICTNSDFEVLIDPVEQGNLYTRGYRLTEQSKQSIIALGRSVGSCSTCDNGYDSSKLRRGFRAVMKATVLDLNENDDDAPPLIEVSDMQHSNELGSDPCQSVFNVAEGITALSTEAPAVPPTLAPSIKPSANPTVSLTETPTKSPTLVPSENPTLSVTETPTMSPTVAPSENPTRSSKAPTVHPTLAPSILSDHPTLSNRYSVFVSLSSGNSSLSSRVSPTAAPSLPSENTTSSSTDALHSFLTLTPSALAGNATLSSQNLTVSSTKNSTTMSPTLTTSTLSQHSTVLSTKTPTIMSPTVASSELSQNPTVSSTESAPTTMSFSLLENVPPSTLAAASDAGIYHNYSCIVGGIIGFLTFWLVLV